MISTGDMKRGATIELDGRVYQVMEFAHIKMGRGSAQMRMKLRDVRRGDIIERTFQAGEKWPRVRVERVPMQFSYTDDDIMYFMNTETYDQVPLTPTRSATRRTSSPRTAPATCCSSATSRSASSCRRPSC